MLSKGKFRTVHITRKADYKSRKEKTTIFKKTINVMNETYFEKKFVFVSREKTKISKICS